MSSKRPGLHHVMRGLLLVGVASCSSNPAETMPTPTPTCADGIKNGTETDVDCGGGTCSKCVDKKACVAASDCGSGTCTNKVCSAPSCTDTMKNGAETDVDCGGGTCSKCPDTKVCTAASDCTSGVCSAKVCTAASCTDTVKNGAETDVDCGGTCNPCSLGLSCTIGADCSTSLCKQGSCQYATSCKDLLAANPTATDGAYTIDPDAAGPIAPLQVLCDMTTDGGGWTLVGKGREGWSWIDAGEGTASELLSNPTTNTVAYLDSAIVAAIVGNPNFNAWNSSLKVHRDSGFNDDYKIRPNAATTFKWSLFSDNRHGCGGNAASPLSGSVNVSASPLGLGAFNSSNADLKDFQNTGNDCTRMFTPLWNSHDCKGGWSTGVSCTPTAIAGINNCFMATNEAHCIPHVRVWVRD